MQIFQHIISQKQEDIYYLKLDFIGFHLNVLGLLQFFAVIIFLLFLFMLFFLIGEKLYKRFFNIPFTPFYEMCFSIGLGYIVLGTLLSFLGMLSLFSPQIIFITVIIVSLIAIYPIYTLQLRMTLVKKAFRQLQMLPVSKIIKVAVVLFLVIIALRLLPPDIGSDALEYHTDYPKLYLQTHTTMLKAVGNESIITVPQLGEMVYVVAMLFHLPLACKYIHFIFFTLTMLCMLCLGANKKYKNTALGSLLLLTSPLVLHIVPSAYGDFQGLFCFFLAVYVLIEHKLQKKTIILSAILLGGMLATKIWSLVFLPIFLVLIIFIARKKQKKEIISFLFLFTFFALTVPLLWYIRSFLIAGDPFSSNNDIGNTHPIGALQRFQDIFHYNRQQLIGIIEDFSPVNIFGVLGLGLLLLYKGRKVCTEPLFLFTIVLCMLYFFLPPYFDGRYVLPGYLFLSLLFSMGIYRLFSLSRRFTYGVGSIFCILFLYYAIHSLLILPYGIGIANSDAYLNRTLVWDNATYYDFNHLFSPHIAKNETIATYGVVGYYYANFSYKNVYYFFYKDKPNTLQTLVDHGIHKLLLRGTDLVTFCKILRVSDCTSSHYQLLAEDKTGKQYLYLLQFDHL